MFHRKPSKYDGMTKWEILDSINSDPYYSHGKMAREAHRALRKFSDGLPIIYRYPDFPYLLSAFAGGFSAVTVFILFLSM